VCSIPASKSPAYRPSRGLHAREFWYENLHVPFQKSTASFHTLSFELDTPAVSDSPDILTYTKRVITEGDIRRQPIETILPMFSNSDLSSRIFNQKSLTPVTFIDRLNNELRKRSYPDDNDISCAAKLTHSTYEEAVPHHLKRAKSADHILTTCCDSVSQVFENHSINSNITECEPRICSTSTINSLNQFNVSVEQKVRNKFVLRCM
jgi:hypothetical protein